MKVMFAFLGERRREFCGYIVFAGIFAAVSYLYNIRMDAVQYAFILSAVWFVLFIVWDYIRYIRRHREVAEMEQRLDSGLDCVPDPVTLIEEDYQRAVMKLYEARCELESSNRIIRQEMADYYGMWVHQIKTPIAAMHVLLQAFEECRLNAEDQAKNTESGLYAGRSAELGQYVREMKMELFKIEQYVEMVLTYLRMEEMSSDLSFEVCSLDSVIKQAVRKYSQMFIFKKIKLEYTPVETKVLTDEKWLEFVIGQILSNALKYTMPDGSTSAPDEAGIAGRISIYMEDRVHVVREEGADMEDRVHVVREEGTDMEDRVHMAREEGADMADSGFADEIQTREPCLVVEDTGIGIWPEDLPRVFEKGFTGYNGRTDKKSTGIGLYLCKSVMDKLRHQIWIESEAGRGTKVYLSFARKQMRHE